MSAREFRSSDVAEICGVTLRQLQWWDENNLVKPRMDNHARAYSEAQAFEVAVVADLKRKGYYRAKLILPSLKQLRKSDLPSRLSDSDDVMLLTNGKVVFIECDSARLIGILKSARIPLSVVSLSDCWRRVRGESRP